MSKFIGFLDTHIRFILWTTMILLFAELSFQTENSLDPRMRFFLWAERGIAALFMVEYVIRWMNAVVSGRRVMEYPTSWFGLIDIIAWLPFLLGFYVPAYALGWIRALRVLRLLKMFRYDRKLQFFALAIYRSRRLIQAIGYVTVIISMFSAVLLYECEKAAQPDAFGNIWNVLLWFIPVTGTTVGYGDMSPATPAGKFFAVTCLLLPLISVVGAFLGVIGSQFQECIELEKNTDIDPLQEFKNG